jgi:hypothetical protein
MSNFPAGVSGNEPQIAGYDERDGTRAVECGNDECRLFEVTSDVSGTDQIAYGEVLFLWDCPSCGRGGERTFDLDADDD